MLAIEVEYLAGVAYAADDRGDGPDWPLQPDRLFSALVASWAARGARPEERRALEWLEEQAPPRIMHSAAHFRTIPQFYVPPNDFETPSPNNPKEPKWLVKLKSGEKLTDPDKKARQKCLGVVPHLRSGRQPRYFPAALPHTPVVRFGWAAVPDEPVVQALDALARDTSYLGHSASLVRCQVRTLDDLGDARPARRGLYAGRLAELERAFQAKERPKPGEAVHFVETADIAIPRSSFGTDWIVFAHTDGPRPDPIAAAVAAKALIKTVQAGYGEGKAPSWVSGHAADGTPLTTSHLAAVPLMDAGWTWSQGRMMGMALILPRDMEEACRRARDPDADDVAPGDERALLDEKGLFQALGEKNLGKRGELKLALHLPGGTEWTLVREVAPSVASLKPWRYLKPARTWASLTPIALDRHPKADNDVEKIIADACERIGLPRPVTVVAGNHSAISGAASAYRNRRAPAWTGWRLPGALAGRRLIHAVIAFAEPVGGPVILGAGRFAGLGLCLGLDGDESRS